jgi:hypothetical protein
MKHRHRRWEIGALVIASAAQQLLHNPRARPSFKQKETEQEKK